MTRDFLRARRSALPGALPCAVLFLLSASGCGDDPAAPGDAGLDASPPRGDAALDARPDPGDGGGGDGGLDAPADAPGGCVQATVPGTWSLVVVDDVSASYSSRISPDIELQPWDLYFESQHVFDPATGGPVELAGTFELGTGADDNYGTCAHCVIAFYGTMRERGYFARAGTLTVAEDPFELDVDVVIEDLELIEVTIDPIDRSSTPVEGGACIRIPRVEIDQTFAPPGWTCGIEEFEDGTECDCECGILDRDCTTPSLPIDGCDPGQLCRPTVAGPIGPFFGDSVCASDCDRDGGVFCPGAQVCIDHAFGDLCSADATELDRTADVGDRCADGALHCAIDAMRISNGYCDLFARADQRCRPRCSVDADCDTGSFERCYVVGSDMSSGTEVPFGFCAIRYPEGWTCGGGDYEDGARCHCECGVVDPDCYDPTLPIAGCAKGETCGEGTCTAS
jgi:hypothetical protein